MTSPASPLPTRSASTTIFLSLSLSLLDFLDLSRRRARADRRFLLLVSRAKAPVGRGARGARRDDLGALPVAIALLPARAIFG